MLETENRQKRIRVIIVAAIFLVWLGLVLRLPAQGSNAVAAIGIAGYLFFVTSRPYEHPRWGSFFLLVSQRPIKIAEENFADADLRTLEALTNFRTPTSAHLERSHWTALYKLLSHSDHGREHSASRAKLLVACLQILEEDAATADLVPSCRLWIALIASLWTHNDGVIAEAAQRCLPVLQARLQQEQFRTSLLRPGERPSDIETLLRPLKTGTESDPKTLLRPSNSGNKPGV